MFKVEINGRRFRLSEAEFIKALAQAGKGATIRVLDISN